MCNCVFFIHPSEGEEHQWKPVVFPTIRTDRFLSHSPIFLLSENQPFFFQIGQKPHQLESYCGTEGTCLQWENGVTDIVELVGETVYVDLISTWNPGRHFVQTTPEFREVLHSSLLSIHNTKCFLQGRKLEDQSFKSWVEILAYSPLKSHHFSC